MTTLLTVVIIVILFFPITGLIAGKKLYDKELFEMKTRLAELLMLGLIALAILIK